MRKGSRWTAADLDAYQNKQGSPVGRVSGGGANFFKNYALWIGIDGGSSTGFAVWSSISKMFVEVSTTDFWGVFDKLQQLERIMEKKTICVVVEDPKQNKGVFLQRKSSVQFDEVKKVVKIAQDVGAVKRESELIIDWLKKNGWHHIAVKPTASKTKDAEYFKKITGWQGRTNQHNRDAALLCFNR